MTCIFHFLSILFFKFLHLTLEGAQEFAREKHAKLEKGIFDVHVSHRIRKLPQDAYNNPDKYLNNNPP
jgi:hypothetical protein